MVTSGWFLIITFMLLKAGLIVAVFMHMLWERLALVYAILVPPLLSGKWRRDRASPWLGPRRRIAAPAW